jgi:tetratricopeptide (TPR) repeat protein
MSACNLLITAAAIVSLSAVPAHAHEDDQLGKVTFPTSCNKKVQAEFEAGVAMLDSFWLGQAEKTFQSVLEKDPKCAIAYWGIAVKYLGNPLGGPPRASDAKAAWAALEKARAIGAKTQRERDWIEAISAYYRDFDNVPLESRLAAYNSAMERITVKYPKDFEAKVYYALTLQASAPRDDVTYANQLKSAAILEKLSRQNPQHPGVLHFLIHAYDYPPLAEKGVAAARRYASIAPAAPHARHMPSHIYSMVGLWEDSIASNMSALEIKPDMYHAYDFMVYAALQLGEDARAKEFIEKSDAAPASSERAEAVRIAVGAINHARWELERGNWTGAAALPVATVSEYRYVESLNHFARGLGMARSGDAAGAERETEAMENLRAELAKADDPYWAARTEEQMMAVAAWIALARGDHAKAEELMRNAADGEDHSVKNVMMENRLYPLRELLAELLMEIGKPAPALHEYETALKEYPNRYRGLYGAARAADAAGERQKAAGYYAKFLVLAKDADPTRAELPRARAYVASR